MPEVWTGNLIGKMHNKDITYDELAEEMGVTKSYISMILNGKRKPPGIRKRMECALDSAIQKKNCTVCEILDLPNQKQDGTAEAR